MRAYLVGLSIISSLLISQPTSAHSDKESGEYNTFLYRLLEKGFHEATPAEQKKYEKGWPKELPSAGITSPGYVRSIIHLHNVYSHDACDGKPQVDGRPNQPCFEDLRAALCALRIDVAFMTEHAGELADHPFEQVINMQNGDTPIMEDGRLTGVIRHCENGHNIHTYLGNENALMSLGLTRHVDPAPGQTLSQAYGDSSPAAIARFQAVGGLGGIAHSEDPEKPADYLATLNADFMEIYNLHAEFKLLLGGSNILKAIGKVFEIIGFSFLNPFHEPDLLFSILQTEHTPSMSKWATLVQQRHITGIAGSDVHQNVFKGKMFDRERVDSYRRNMRWFNNYIYAAHPEDRASVLQSVREGRVMVVFELYGTPSGFEFNAASGTAQAEMGGTLQSSGGYTVRTKIPKLVFTGKSEKEPKLRARILRAEGDHWVEVASGDGEKLEYAGSAPGVYRTEILVRPAHLSKYLPNKARWNKEHVWIYSNPIWVR